MYYVEEFKIQQLRRTITTIAGVVWFYSSTNAVIQLNPFREMMVRVFSCQETISTMDFNYATIIFKALWTPSANLAINTKLDTF